MVTYGVVGDKGAQAGGEDGEASHTVGGAVERRVGALNAKKIQIKKNTQKNTHTRWIVGLAL